MISAKQPISKNISQQSLSIAATVPKNGITRSAVPVLQAAKKSANPAKPGGPLISIDQPAVNQSADVPDLTKDQVTEINNAKTKDERIMLIKSIANYLIAKNVLTIKDVVAGKKVLSPADKFEDDRFCIKIDYYTAAKTGNTALTYLAKSLGKNNDQLWFNMDFYPEAFESPSVLYSTIRHELIHIGQRTKQPDEWKASKKDEMTFEYNDNFGTDTGAPVSSNAKTNEKDYKKMTVIERRKYATHVGFKTTGANSIQSGLQEIETHAWELEHANETGIPQKYITETKKQLKSYIKLLQEGLAKATPLQSSFWGNYIDRAEELINRPGVLKQKTRILLRQVAKKLATKKKSAVSKKTKKGKKP